MSKLAASESERLRTGVTGDVVSPVCHGGLLRRRSHPEFSHCHCEPALWAKQSPLGRPRRLLRRKRRSSQRQGGIHPRLWKNPGSHPGQFAKRDALCYDIYTRQGSPRLGRGFRLSAWNRTSSRPSSDRERGSLTESPFHWKLAKTTCEPAPQMPSEFKAEYGAPEAPVIGHKEKDNCQGCSSWVEPREEPSRP